MTPTHEARLVAFSIVFVIVVAGASSWVLWGHFIPEVPQDTHDIPIDSAPQWNIAFVSGTEYFPGQEGQVIVEARYPDGSTAITPITSDMQDNLDDDYAQFYYDFRNDSVPDLSSNNNDGSLLLGAEIVNETVVTASGESVSAPVPLWNGSVGDWSVAMDFEPVDDVLGGLMTANSPSGASLIYNGYDDRLRVSLPANDTWYVTFSLPSISPGRLYSLVAKYDASADDVEVWINGTNVTNRYDDQRQGTVTNSSESSLELSRAWHSNVGNIYSSEINTVFDDWYFTYRELSPTEIQQVSDDEWFEDPYTNCEATVWYPNKTRMVDSQVMTYQGDSQNAYVEFTVPRIEGVYEYQSTCTVNGIDKSVSKSFHVTKKRIRAEAIK